MALCSGDGPAFSLDVSSHGASSLRTAIMDKLSEFIGSSTDDVLAEYVLVLVSHGKHQMQAIKDLEAFLGDQSGNFVTWLWNHLGSNIHLYTSDTKKSSSNFDTTNVRLLEEMEEKRENIVETVPTSAKVKERSSEKTPSEDERLITLGKDADAKFKKEVSMATSCALRQAESTVLTRRCDGSTYSAKRSHSPDSWTQTERSVSEKKQRHSSPSHVSATRRLLQSAFREAVAPTTGHTKRPVRERTTSVSSVKRLQSVILADVENSEIVMAEQKPTARQGKRAMPAMMMAMKAAAAAAEDATLAVPTRQGKRAMPAIMVAMQPASAVAVDVTLSVQNAEQQPASRQGKRAMPAMMMAMKAAAAAAKDVAKSRGRVGGDIWERLGEKSTEIVENKTEEHSRYVFDGNDAEENRFTSEHEDEHEEKRQRLDSEDIISAESISDAVESVFDECTDQSMTTREMHVGREKGTEYNIDGKDEGFGGDYNIDDSENMRPNDRQRQTREESVTVEYRVARNMEGAKKESYKQKGPVISSELTSSSQKIVNISVNVNTWKPGSYNEKLIETENNDHTPSFSIPNLTLERVSAANTTNAEMKGANSSDLEVPCIKKQVCEGQTETINTDGRQPVTISEVQKAAVSSGPKQTRKPDDTELRTVFVTNIHFAASKESVAAHFVSCGEIGRIVMLTDGATGQPKGSAYIEFKTKDAADRALALNESSFFSRALKVVRKNAAVQAIQEMNPLMHPALIRRPIPLSLRLPRRGRFARGGSSFLLPRRFPTMPRPYGSFPSLQWKRDTTTLATPAFSGVVNPSVMLNGARPRSLSYARATNTSAMVDGEQAKIPLESGKDIQMGDLEMEQA